MDLFIISLLHLAVGDETERVRVRERRVREGQRERERVRRAREGKRERGE